MSYTLETAKRSVGKGWHGILERLWPHLEGATVTTVKEKYGGLRVYVGPYIEAVERAIGEAESEALRTCEQCGEPGEPDLRHYWIKTLCGSCKEKRP